MKIGLIAYNFPHRKTQDFLFRLLAEGHEIDVILAQDYKELNIPPTNIRTSVKFNALVHPKDIAESFDINFEEVDHDSKKMVALVNEYNLDIGIISGARILKERLIRAFNLGILNFHPGLLPEVRGLDALKWSILKDIPPGISVHTIDERVDAGKVLLKERINVERDDTLFDLDQKIYSKQLNNISQGIEKLKNKDFLDITFSKTKYNSKMTAKDEEAVMQKLPGYIDKYCSGV